MKNDYKWALNDDYIAHFSFGLRGAHYSKNWDKAKQDDYNRWYYQTHKGKYKDRWMNSHLVKGLRAVGKASALAKKDANLKNAERASAVDAFNKNKSAKTFLSAAKATGKYALARGKQFGTATGRNALLAAKQIAYDNEKYSNANINKYMAQKVGNSILGGIKGFVNSVKDTAIGVKDHYVNKGNDLVQSWIDYKMMSNSNTYKRVADRKPKTSPADLGKKRPAANLGRKR